jgi:hypothetical protein
MYGLGRHYRSGDSETGGILSAAYNDGCDAVVAVATLGNGEPAALEAAIFEFLNTRPMVLWIKKELGLEFVRREW